MPKMHPLLLYSLGSAGAGKRLRPRFRSATAIFEGRATAARRPAGFLR